MILHTCLCKVRFCDLAHTVLLVCVRYNSVTLHVCRCNKGFCDMTVNCLCKEGIFDVMHMSVSGRILSMI